MTAIFTLGECFSSVQAGSLNYTTGWCIGEMLIFTMATVCLVGSSFLLWWQVEAHQFRTRDFFGKHTTWIYILMILYCAMVWLKYLLNLNYLLRDYGLWIITIEFLQSMILYTTCSLFAQKVSENVESMAWVSRSLNLMLIPTVCIYGLLSLVRIFGKNDEKLTCHSICFLLSEGLNLVISILFLGIGWSINRTTKIAVAERLQ